MMHRCAIRTTASFAGIIPIRVAALSFFPVPGPFPSAGRWTDLCRSPPCCGKTVCDRRLSSVRRSGISDRHFRQALLPPCRFTVFRAWSNYTDGVVFVILLMNLCVPLLDQLIVKQRPAPRAVRPAALTPSATEEGAAS